MAFVEASGANRLAGAIQSLGQRAARMAGAWLAVGVVVGLCNGIHLGGHGVVIAGQVVAGMIVYPCLGAFLALIADTAVESLAAAAIGLLVGAIGPVVGGRWPQFEQLALMTTVGALVGATCLPWLRLTLRTAGALVRALRPKRDLPVHS